jgi:alkylated DNA nucleotide flippase Atl1
MSKPSVAFVNMKRALLQAVQTIPSGCVTEVGDLAKSLNIPARHAAFILAKLAADEEAEVPWHRVIPRNGDFGKKETRTDRQAFQIKRLQAEGLKILNGQRLQLDPSKIWSLDEGNQTTIWADADSEP